MSRILILGANGLLGQAAQKVFADDYIVYTSSMEDTSYLADLKLPYFKVDLTNRSEVRELIIKTNPDIVLNTAAYTNVDGCEDERETCWAVNVLAVENILEAPYLEKPIIIQISTDYVFDGEMGNYREIDKPNPRGNYARSKMAAENIISSSDFEYMILRTQVLFGAGKNIRPNFVTWLVQHLKENKPVKIVNDQVGSPTYAADVAEAAKRLLGKKSYGLYHVSSPDKISRFDFALEIANIFDLDSGLINETNSDEFEQKAPRPMDSSFVIDKLFNNTGWQPQTVEEALKKLRNEMENK